MRLAFLLLLVRYADGSPTMCQCPGGGLGMTCPTPITLNCPPMQCPPAPPCNPFPTLAPLVPQSNGIQGIAQFTLPTLPPMSAGGGPFGIVQTTPLPLPVSPPTNGQESLVPLQNTQHQQFQLPQQPTYQLPQQPQQQQYIPPAPAAATATVPPPLPPPPPPPQQAVQPAAQYAEVPNVDATTRATTLPSESYVDADLPEGPPEDPAPSDKSFPLYENQPNNGYRQPIRRALAANGAASKPEVFTDKCNDERLKKIIEENIDSNPSSSKRKIQKAASDEIGGLFDVICSSHDFSYLANTQLFCEAGNDDVTCFAFLHTLIQ
ncbi:hypothetical protein Q1695_003890 [Nippostrongylus brasiliensis]|nr:hypothetical protein Q1695_003890 [Nippostrongylus brasiliensis]